MKKIGLFKPYMSWRARLGAFRVLLGDMIGEGPMVKKFEREFSQEFNLPLTAVAVNSGTSALELAYEIAGIGPGDEVITTILTCTATNIPLLHRGAKIVFADIDYDLNIDIHDVEKKITKKTKAVVFVHFGGNNRGLADLLDICEKRGIALIEDAAQAIGSDYWGKSDYTCVSLQAIKALTSVDGGFLICKKEEDRQKAKRLRWYGYDRDLKHKNGDTDLTEAGYKMHMSDVTAAIGLGNLRSLKWPLDHRRMLADIYSRYGINAHSWLAVGMLQPTTAIAAFRMNMAAHGVEVGQHHYRNDKYSIFKKFKSYVPVMDEVENQYVFLPYHTGVSEAQAHKIGELYRKYR